MCQDLLNSSPVNNIIKQQCLQVHQPQTMQKLIIFLAFSNLVLSFPIEENVEVVEAKEAKESVDLDDEAARNARFNFGYSIQVRFDLLLFYVCSIFFALISSL